MGFAATKAKSFAADCSATHGWLLLGAYLGGSSVLMGDEVNKRPCSSLKVETHLAFFTHCQANIRCIKSTCLDFVNESQGIFSWQ